MSTLLVAATAALAVFPPPRATVLAEGNAAARVALPSAFSLAAGVRASGIGSARLARAAGRYDALLQRAAGVGEGDAAAAAAAPAFKITIVSKSEALNGRTRYDYNITVGAAAGAENVDISAGTIYGAMYAFETLVQMSVDGAGVLPAGAIIDAPLHPWRGLMVDTGRRFFPMPLLKNLLDTMAAVKMNVLHLHAADYCRFSIESKIYPNLTAALTGLQAGHYSQADIKALVAYAKDRGIRVVPEFDIPGHARGFLPLEGHGVSFCTDDAGRFQLYNDPAGETVATLKALFREMSALFEDEVFNIGCDETAKRGRCDLRSTFTIETELQRYVAEDLGKTPQGWEEVLFNAKAAQPNTIVSAWSRHRAGDVTARGHLAIESFNKHFYYTWPAAEGPDGWAPCWFNISASVPAGQQQQLLGGEISMWTDKFLYIDQCKNPKVTPPGAVLYDPAHDDAFGRAIGGMIWPRGYVAAHAFWNFDGRDVTADAYVAQVKAFNDQVRARGGLVCPTGCACDYTTACGKPYVQ